MSAKALVEKCMLRKINKREKQISTLPSFTLTSQGNTKENKETQGNSRVLKGTQGYSRELKGTHLNSFELEGTRGNSREL